MHIDREDIKEKMHYLFFKKMRMDFICSQKTVILTFIHQKLGDKHRHFPTAGYFTKGDFWKPDEEILWDSKFHYYIRSNHNPKRFIKTSKATAKAISDLIGK